MSTYIVYACPTGILADHIDRYYAVSLERYGPNAAHKYMPHCTLTGFFHDEPDSIPTYITALEAALDRARATQPSAPLVIIEMVLREDFHGLLLDGPWLKAFVADFARTVNSPTRQDALRLKEWLHLSLAYEFPPQQHEPLAELARTLVDITTDVQWNLCFYERHEDGAWTCHAHWPL